MDEGFGTYNISISNVFDDADNDVLTYTVSSNNTSVIVPTLSGTTLTLSEAGVGNATITLTANDGNGGVVSDIFIVTVNTAANNPPTVINPIADLNLEEGFSTYNINIAFIFEDVDNDVLSYTVSSSNPAIVTTNISGLTLIISEVGVGNSTITLTANDGNGGMANDVFLVTVNAAPNNPPTVINPLPDLNLDEDFGTYNIDIANVFDDIDNDVLSFSVSSSNNSIITPSVSGTTLTLTEVGIGTITITLTAYDGNGGIANDIFLVTVNEINHPPTVINHLPYLNLDEGFSIYTIDISNVFDDEDGDILSYTVSSSNTSVIIPSLSGTTLTLTEAGVGSASITLTANDGNGGVANDIFIVAVNAVNHDPIVINPLPDLNLDEDFGTYFINISNVFDDEDNDVLSYTVSSSNTSVIIPSLSGNILTLTEAGIGNATIFLTANDGNGGVASDVFLVIVNDINHAPVVINPLPDLDLDEDFGTYNINISNVFNDADNDILSFSVTSSNNSIITASLSGNILTLTEAGIGNATITLTANDGNGGVTSDVFLVTVNDINHAPIVINPLPDLSLDENFSLYNIDISNVFNDEDNDVLSYSVTSSNNSIITPSLSGNILTLTETGVGIVSISLTANDGNGETATDIFLVTVNSINHAPTVINPLPDLDLDEDFGTYNIDIANVFDDEDGDALSYAVSSSNTSVIIASLSGTTLTLTGTGVGNIAITLIANDGNGGVASDIFLVTVNPLNHAPTVVNPLPDLDLDEDFGTYNIDISNVFDDEDGDALSYTVSSSSAAVVTVSLSGTTLIITESGIGTAIITLTASDGNGGVTNDTFIVTVNAVNHIPTVANPLPDLNLNEDFGTYNIDIANVFVDPDNDVLSYTVSSSNTSVISPSLSGNTLILSESGVGNATITLTANDGNGGTANDIFVVTVNAVNHAPIVINPLPDLDLDEDFGTYNIDIANVFDDQDNDVLSYAVISSNTTVISPSLSGTTLILSESGIGNATITLTANDGNGGVAYDEFIVTVNDINHAPIVINPLPDLELDEDFGTYNIDIANVFNDIDNDVLSYTVNSNNTTVVTTSISGVTLVLSEIGIGNATITLTANDGNGGEVNDIFMVTVNAINHAPIVVNPLPDLDLDEGFVTYNIDIVDVFEDADNDVLSYTVNSNNSSVIESSLSGTTLTITEVGIGSATVTLIANDGNGGVVSDEFLVGVNATANNVPTVINPLPDLILDEGFTIYTIDISNVFDDADGDILTYSVSSNIPTIITAALSGTTLTLTETGIGAATITLSADDGNGGVISDVFLVIVNAAPNNAPVVINPIPDYLLDEDFGTYNIDISDVFEDADGDILNYTVTSSNNAVITPTVSGTTLVLYENGIGSATITLTADDGNGGTASDDFIVTINAVNHAPIVINPIPDIDLSESFGTYEINISNVFSDADGDILNYSVESGNNSIVVATISGTTLTLTEAGLGSTTITLTADDGNGGTANDIFLVTINTSDNNAPVVINPLPDLELVENFSIYEINISNVFNDEDEDYLNYSVSSNNTSVIIPSLSEDILTLGEAGIGLATITLTVDDGNGGVASDIFDVAVEELVFVMDEPTQNPIKVYPNPSTGIINISIKDYEGDFDILVYDISGKKIIEKQFEDTKQGIIDLSNTERGLYFVRISAKDINLVKKIILE